MDMQKCPFLLSDYKGTLAPLDKYFLFTDGLCTPEMTTPSDAARGRAQDITQGTSSKENDQ